MGQKLKSSSSFLTALLVGVMVVLLAGIIVFTYFFAPEKPPPPPVSVVKYEAPPSLQSVSYRFDESLELDSGIDIENPYEPTEKDHQVRGIITNKETGEPLRKARIEASWELTDDEKHAHQTLVGEALNAGEIDDEDIEDKEEEAEDEADDADGRKKGDRWELINAADRKYENSRSAISDSRGKYRIYIPKDRPVTIRYRRQGFIATVFEDVELETEKAYTEINVALDVGAMIGGRVTEEGTGKPVFGMPINISRVENGRPVHNYLDYGHGYGYETDEKGVYSIYGLVPGEYEIGVYVSDSRYQEGKELPYKRVTLVEVEQKITNIDFQLARAGVVWGYTIDPDTDLGTRASLVLVTSDNIITQGINAMFTAVMNQEEPEFFGSQSTEKKDGYYEIGGVPFNKEFRVYAMTDGAAPQLSDPFILTPGEPDIRVDINMFDGSDLFGRVVDSKFRPVEGAEVTCIPSFTELFSPLSSSMAMATDKSDKDGYFEIEGIPGGNYQLFAFREGYKLTARGVPVFTDGFSDVSGLTIQLSQVDSGEHIIYGQVTDSKGFAIPGAEINLAGISTGNLDGLESSTLTDENGEYLFEGMTIGKYFILASAGGGYASKSVMKVYLDKPTPIQLEAGALFKGRVLIKETGRPPGSGTHVTAKPTIEFKEGFLSALENVNFEDSSTQVDNDTGEFELYLNPGKYTIKASHEGFVDGQISVSLNPDDIKTGTIYVSKTGGSIEGVVRTRDSQSPQGTRVSLQRVTQKGNSLLDSLVDIEGMFTGESVRVDSDGKFQFESLPSGNYMVYAHHKNYANGQSDLIPLPDNSSATGVTIWLTSGGQIEGYVTSRGRPSADTVVMLMSATSPISASTDSSGFYFFESVSPGTHYLQVIGIQTLGNLGSLENLADLSGNMDSNLGTDKVVVREGQTTRHDIRK